MTALRTADVLVAMDVDEEDNVVIAPESSLQSGETIVAESVVRSSEVYSGTDEDPEAIFDGLPVLSAGRLIQRVHNPNLGATYLLRFVVPLSSGRVLVGAGLLPTTRLGSPT